MISPRNARLGFATLTKRVGLANRADSTDGELIKYRVCSNILIFTSHILKLNFSTIICLISFIHAMQWDDPHVVPADMTVEVSELFTRELTRVTIALSFLFNNAIINTCFLSDKFM